MPLRNLAVIVLASVMLLAALGCSSEGESQPASPGRASTATATAQPEIRLQYPGLALQLAAGDFWEFGWTWSETNCAQGSGCRTSDEAGTFLVLLGDARPIDGVDFHELILTGAHTADGGKVDLAPAWTHLGVDGPRLLGSTGRTRVTLFDARTGEWTGSGFFSRFGGIESHVAGGVSLSGDHPMNSWDGFRAGPAVVVARSDSETNCEIIEGLRICPRDQAFTLVESQYYREGIGPVGYTYSFGMSFSGGSFFSSVASKEVVALVASSLRGDPPPPSAAAAAAGDGPSRRPPRTPAPGGITLPSRIPYVELVDDTGTLRVELPSSWSDVRTDPITASDGSEWTRIMAAPDLAGFDGSWGGPGLVIQVGPEGVLIPDLAAWLEASHAVNRADCTVVGRDSSTGLASMSMVDCDGQATGLIVTASYFGTHTVAVTFQFRNEADLQHFTRLSETLAVCDSNGCLLE